MSSDIAMLPLELEHVKQRFKRKAELLEGFLLDRKY